MKVYLVREIRPDWPTLWLTSPTATKQQKAILQNHGLSPELLPMERRLTFYRDGVREGLQVVLPDDEVETLRRGVYYALRKAEEVGWKKVQLRWIEPPQLPDRAYAYQSLGELAVMSLYRFTKYVVEPIPTLEEIAVFAPEGVAEQALEKGLVIGRVVNRTRDWVNEPPNVMTAVALAEHIQALGKAYNFRVEIWDKARIQAEKMGGLLAVNQGSMLPPTFTIAEYQPDQVRNKKPIVLVGKGLVFDTGGLSLKPTPDSMDYMKVDMAGGAVVANVVAAAAELGLPYHLIALVPATDNRPGENAYTPSDIIYISDGTPVEIRNTDAEGRLILADALVHARRYNPALVVDVATLTGAAALAVGPYASALFTNAGPLVRDGLLESGFRTYERLVEFPLWPEYGHLIKSDIAAIKNSAGREGGAITAAKFLEYFVRYPWAHLDIAGTAYYNKPLPPDRGFPKHYQVKYATGVGVRLLLDFIERYGDRLS
jgi:leucyl aminopeptidase